MGLKERETRFWSSMRDGFEFLGGEGPAGVFKISKTRFGRGEDSPSVAGGIAAGRYDGTIAFNTPTTLLDCSAYSIMTGRTIRGGS